ncbi:protein of unknown function [Paraburkholderia kururiensis]
MRDATIQISEDMTLDERDLAALALELQLVDERCAVRLDVERQRCEVRTAYHGVVQGSSSGSTGTRQV